MDIPRLLVQCLFWIAFLSFSTGDSKTRDLLQILYDYNEPLLLNADEALRIERQYAKGGASKTGKERQGHVNQEFLQYSIDEDENQNEKFDDHDDLTDDTENIDQQTNNQETQQNGHYREKPVHVPVPPVPQVTVPPVNVEPEEECPDDLPSYRVLGKEKCGLLVDEEVKEEVVNPKEIEQEEKTDETNLNQYPTQHLPDYVSQTQGGGSYGGYGPNSNWAQVAHTNEEIEEEEKEEEQQHQQQHQVEVDDEKEEFVDKDSNDNKYEQTQTQDKNDQYQEEQTENGDYRPQVNAPYGSDNEQIGYQPEQTQNHATQQQHTNGNPNIYQPDGGCGVISAPNYGQPILPAGPNHDSSGSVTGGINEGGTGSGGESHRDQTQTNSGTGGTGGYSPIRYGSKQTKYGGKSAGFDRDDPFFTGVIETPHYSSNQATGGDFTCFQKSAGYYVDYRSDCRKFYRCAVGHFQAYEFECGYRTKFNIQSKQCEHEEDVHCSINDRYD